MLLALYFSFHFAFGNTYKTSVVKLCLAAEFNGNNVVWCIISGDGIIQEGAWVSI